MSSYQIIEKVVTKAANSLEYDFNQEIMELKHTMLLNTEYSGNQNSVPEIKSLGFSLPIQNLKTFLEFEEAINEKENENKLV